MYVDNLVLEITRKCNAACSHCLRGNAENVDMSYEILEEILKNVTSIGLVTFSGGEPSLVPERIRYFFEKIKEKNIELKNFCLITNGKIASKELVTILGEMYSYSQKYFDIDCSKLIISRDHFHKKEIPNVDEAMNLYSTLIFFDPNEKTRITDEDLVNEGRCANSCYGHEAYLDSLKLKKGKDGEIESINGILFITALGDIVSCSDLSYSSEEKKKIGNILEKTLNKILIDYQKNF